MFLTAFDSPWYLWLLLGIPLLWVFSFRSLSGLGRWRRLVVLGLRTLVCVLLVFALADMQKLRRSERLTVIYLLDQSLSIPAEQRQAMVEYAARSVEKFRNQDREDRAGVIVFGREARVEVPPLDDKLPLTGRLEAAFDMQKDATNLEAALKLAQASFAEDSARRIVIVTDGNETMGNSQSVARMLAENGIAFDAVPIRLTSRGEVAVEKVDLPEESRKGQPLEARIVLNNQTPATTDNPGNIKGTIKLERRAGQTVETLDERNVELPPGKQVFTFEHIIEQPDFYTYTARFVPENPDDDLMSQNNRASAFTHVRGQGHVLLIEDWENKGEFDFLVKRLRQNNIQVTVQGSDQLFANLAELQRYDSVILANVPHTSGFDAASITNFSDAQEQALVSNTQQMGAGIVMIGGPNSFGAGGWANSELEKAMPVDFHIKNTKVVPVGALVLMMHASEMADGNRWQKIVSREAIKTLGSQDFCGLIHWSDQTWKEDWLWGQPNGMLRVGPNRTRMLKRLGAMTPGDMPEFEPAMQMALAGFNAVPRASTKHMIVISDGDPSPPKRSTTLKFKNFKPKGVRISTVAVGSHGAAGSMGNALQDIATTTGGKYYVVKNAQALPRIFQREARRVAQPLIYDKIAIQPKINYPHEILRGVDGPLPALRGFVLTSVKDNPLVEVSIVSPEPKDQKNATILASWTYGLGKTAVFTSDAGKRWATEWTGWQNYDKLFSQLVRWSMRPSTDQGKYTVASDVKDGKVRVVITALDKDDQFKNFLDVVGTAVSPDMSPFDINIRQTAPGRYVGEFDADQSGSYFLTLVPEAGRAPIRTGINVPYSAEFRDRDSNTGLLISIAGLTPKGGKPGKVIPGSLAVGRVDELMSVDPFRHNLPKAISTREIWPILLVLAGCVFFCDVAVRRVMIGFEWLVPLLLAVRNRLLGRDKEPVQDERLERLRSRKAQVGSKFDERRSSVRFEPQPDEDVPPETLEQTMSTPSRPAKHRPTGASAAPDSKEDDSYTARLLKAKERMWKDKGGKKGEE